MTKRRFGKRLALGAILAVMLATPAVTAQETGAASKPVKLISAGGILSGELNALRGKAGERVATYQLTSEPRRLPPPNGLCNLETGPETFQIVARNDAQAAQLRSLKAEVAQMRALMRRRS